MNLLKHGIITLRINLNGINYEVFMSMSTGMSVGSSAAMPSTNGANVWQQQKQNLEQLSQALSSGNLGAANQAFNALSANTPKGISADPDSALSKIGKALKTGDIQVVQAMLSDMKTGKSLLESSKPQTATAVSAPTTSANIGTIINTMA